MKRSLMAWLRTSLSMISFGFTIGKLGQTLQEINVTGLRGMHMIGIDSFDAKARAGAAQKITNVEIMLVLDVSGSMAGSKLAKAAELGVKVLDEDAFVTFLAGQGITV